MVPDPQTPRQPPSEDDDLRAYTAVLHRDAERLRQQSRELAARYQALIEQYRQWLSRHPPPGSGGAAR